MRSKSRQARGGKVANVAQGDAMSEAKTMKPAAKPAEPTVYEFRTIENLHSIPLEKIPAFCEDLRLWLSLIRLAEKELPAGKVKNREVFGWIDDNRHDVNLKITINHEGLPNDNKK